MIEIYLHHENCLFIDLYKGTLCIYEGVFSEILQAKINES